MGSKTIPGQISIFEIFAESVNHRMTLNEEKKEWLCPKCLYRESHRCVNQTKCPGGFEFILIETVKVRRCLCASTKIYQDGYIHCPILKCTGCEECEKLFFEHEYYHSELEYWRSNDHDVTYIDGEHIY